MLCLYCGGVAAFVFALASRAELLLFAFDEVAHFGQHHRVAVALVGGHVSYVVFAVRFRRRVHHRRVGADALAPRVLVLRLRVN